MYAKKFYHYYVILVHVDNDSTVYFALLHADYTMNDELCQMPKWFQTRLDLELCLD